MALLAFDRKIRLMRFMRLIGVRPLLVDRCVVVPFTLGANARPCDHDGKVDPTRSSLSEGAACSVEPSPRPPPRRWSPSLTARAAPRRPAARPRPPPGPAPK